MSHEEYQQIGALNYSGAKIILVSPLHYKTWLTAEREESPALKTGRLVHLASLQPDVFDATVRILPECDRRTKDGKAIYEAFVSTLKPSEECIKKDEMDEVLAVAESAQAGIETIAKGFEATRLVEQTYTAKFGGINIKGRPDLVLVKPDGAIVVDVKTTQDASPKAFAKDVANYKYHLQAAFYMQLTGATEFYIVAVEKHAPYAHAIYKFDEAAIEAGRALMRTACAVYGDCNLYGTWPGYASTPQILSLPKWAFSDSLDA